MSVNVLNLFDRTSRRHRSHGARKYNKPEIHNVSFDGLLPFVNLQLGLHHIRTRLYSLPLKMLHDLYESTLTLHFADVASPEHRLQGIILDISSNRLFKAVSVCDFMETKNRPFLKIKFANKGIDALNLSNILNQKSVQSNVPPYFQNKESPCISYSYTRSVASKIFNYKRSLQQIDFNSLSQNPLPCTCSGSQFLYAPCGHVVTGDLNIVRNEKLRDLLRKGPKFREPVSFSWHQNFDIIMDACEIYARQWAKKEDVELDTLSEWIKSIGDVVKRRIRRLKHSVNTRYESIFRDPDVVHELSRLHENFVIVPADKASNNYTFVCKKHYVDILIEELGLYSLPGNPNTIWRIFLHQKCWTTTNQSSLPSEYRQTMRSSICLTFIGFRRCTKIHINIDSLRVHQSVRPSLCPFYSQNCLHILSKVSRSTARQPTLGVGSIRCGSSKIQKSF